jgi:hypothetical protein
MKAFVEDLLEMSCMIGVVLHMRYCQGIGIMVLIFSARSQHLLKIWLYFVVRVGTIVYLGQSSSKR